MPFTKVLALYLFAAILVASCSRSIESQATDLPKTQPSAEVSIPVSTQVISSDITSTQPAAEPIDFSLDVPAQESFESKILEGQNPTGDCSFTQVDKVVAFNLKRFQITAEVVGYLSNIDGSSKQELYAGEM